MQIQGEEIKILQGIRVLDWTIYQQGPVCTAMLADLGADVIKLEQPVNGDPGRGMMDMIKAMFGGDIAGNPYYENNNRGKRCITLDMRKEEGKNILYQLIEKSDVFVHNFRVGVAEKMGLNYEILSQYNPMLVYAHASGWGPNGPDASTPSADYTGIARSGIMSVAGEPDMPPQMVQAGIADQMGATMTSYGILAALLARERFGIGQKVDASLLGSMMHLMGLAVTMSTMAKLPTMRISRKNSGNPLWNYYKCKDDKWIALAHLQPDKSWPNLCKAMNILHLENDTRFDNMTNRSRNAKELIKIFDEIFANKQRDQWVDLLKEHGCVCSPLNNISDLENDPQAKANEYITEFDHPSLGKIKEIGFPVTYSKTPASIQKEAPDLGQHTDDILTEILGFSEEKITRLREAEII